MEGGVGPGVVMGKEGVLAGSGSGAGEGVGEVRIFGGPVIMKTIRGRKRGEESGHRILAGDPKQDRVIHRHLGGFKEGVEMPA